VNPLPAAVAAGRADDLDPGRLQLGSSDVDVVDLEQRHRPACVLAEEVEIRVAGRHQLNLVALARLELHRGGLVEVRTQPHHRPEQFPHRGVVLGRDPDPADVPYLHARVLPEPPAGHSRE
jgi:hypothetical protein